MEKFIFIYAKGNEIRALNYAESSEQHSTLIKENWKHTQTLNSCMYIEYLHNWCENLSKEIKLLSIPKK